MEDLKKLTEQAQEASEKRDWPTAIELLIKVIKVNARYPGAYDLLDEVQKRQEAAAKYQQVLEHVTNKNWKKAIEGLEAVLQDDPEHPDAPAKLEEAKKWAKIEQLLDEVETHRQNFEWKQVVETLGHLLSLQDSNLDFDWASFRQQLTDAQEEVKLERLYQAGERHFKQRNWQVAQGNFEELNHLRPGYRDLPLKLKEVQKQLALDKLYRQAEEYERAGEWSQAIDLYIQVFQQDRNYPGVLTHMTSCQEKLKPVASPVEKKRKWLTISLSAWFLLGLVFAMILISSFKEPLHCSLEYRVTEVAVGLIVASAGGVVAAINTLVPTDKKKVLWSVYGGIAFVVLLGLFLTLVSQPPRKDECPQWAVSPSSFCNGIFDYGWSCWDHGGELTQTITITDSNHLVSLGNPDYPCIGGVPVGEAWASQSFQVPGTSEVSLSFSYEMYSHDIDISDTFEAYINKGQPDQRLILKTGNSDWVQSSCENQAWRSGWKTERVSLEEFKGKLVTLSFHNINRSDQNWNTWTFLDDVFLLP